MAQRSPVYRRDHRVYAAPVRPRRAFMRRLRRLLVLLVVIAAGALALRAYILQVYAPSLRAEARSVPALVQADLARHNASYHPLDAISPDLQNAIVAVEDRRFYLHPGVDPLGIARALWVDLTAQHVDQGGSTLEEQLVKRAIVHQDSSFRAKIRTMALAWAVDQEFDKRRVLELYLNAAYYGQGAYGAGAAAQVYFGTDAAHLSLPQAAFLAALPQAPSVYGAHPRSTAVVDRQRTVLHDMETLGYITAAQESVAARTPLSFAFPNP